MAPPYSGRIDATRRWGGLPQALPPPTEEGRGALVDGRPGGLRRSRPQAVGGARVGDGPRRRPAGRNNGRARRRRGSCRFLLGPWRPAHGPDGPVEGVARGLVAVKSYDPYRIRSPAR